ncbi:MAG: hypothetical protein CL940_04810 [Deltaproteobacteria bacterium]|nr:hypothetical protein [Deltaproteobacteria bacterium]
MNTRAIRSFSLLLTLPLLALPACGDEGSSGGGEGASCVSDADCRADFECIEEVVYASEDQPAAKLSQCSAKAPRAVGDPCTSNEDCATSLRCSEPESVTVAGYLEDCSQEDVICGDALACDGQSNTCLALSPPEGLAGWYETCASNSDCMPGLGCEDFEVPGESASRACLHQNIGKRDVSYCEMIPGEGALGSPCYADSDCISLMCLSSEYGPPFCSRACETVEEPCPAGPDAQESDSLCLSFTELPDPNAPPFIGELETFCVPRCSLDVQDCIDQNPNWEVCEPPTYLGDPLYPNLGSNYRVCQAPSFQGKDPVDPLTCAWEKTIGQFANEANICRKYCSYLETCKEISMPANGLDCCQWGCFNRMVLDGDVNDPWYDEAKCYIETHFAYPDVGQQNSCNQPPQQCNGTPADPTPPAATGAGG